MKITKELNEAIEVFNHSLQQTIGEDTLFSIVIYDETGVMLASNTDKELALHAIETLLMTEKKQEPSESTFHASHMH